MLDLYKLGIFAAVVRQGSFSAAAESLYLTQSAVSQHIKDLESSLGQTLFVRGWRGVTLTPEGEVLAGYARKIFALVAEAENALTDVHQLESGKVSIGATPGVGVYRVPEWVQRFRERYPRLTVALQTGITAQIVTDVLAHRLDIGIIEGELDDFHQPRLAHRVLEEVEQHVVVGFKHPFWDTNVLHVADLDHQTMIVRQAGSHSRIWLERTLRQYGIEPQIGAEFDNLESMKRAVAAGRCLAILPLYVVQAELDQHLLHAIPVEGRPFTRSLKLIWDGETPFSPVVQAFVDELERRYQ